MLKRNYVYIVNKGRAARAPKAGLVSEYFLNKMIPNIMGPFYVHCTPNIMDPFYVLSAMGPSYVHQTHNIMGLFYVNGPIFYYGSFFAPPTVHKKDP